MDPIGALAKLKEHPYVSEHVTLEWFSEPYDHVVIRNLLKDDVLEKMQRLAPEYIAREKAPYGAIGPEKTLYDATIYGIGPQDCVDGYDFFASKEWKDFHSALWDLELLPQVALSLHFHPGSKEKPSRDGWSHRDLGICSVLPTTSACEAMTGCEYVDDSWNAQPHTVKVARSVALLFYFNNPEDLTEEDGGGTALFSSYRVEDRVKVALPTNNTLFAFAVNTRSYHGFVGARFDRTAVVHWFHSNPSYFAHKRFPELRAMFQREGRVFEHWKKDDLWTLEMDPEYGRYFDRPFMDLLKLKVLVVGGTQMLGRDFVESMKGRANLTIANRNTKPELFPDVPKIVFDRNVPASCAALNTTEWDVVIDFSCYSCEQLWDVLANVRYGKYVYVSTQSVFDDATIGARNYADPYYWYCIHKRQIETYIRHHMRGRNWIVARPYAVTGVHDYTNRFEERDGKFYWKHDGSEATTGTVHVSAVTQALARMVFETNGYAEIDIY